MPAIESLQVQYLVAFVVQMLGTLTGYIGDAITLFGGDLVAAGSDAGTMQNLTTGIFGTNSGLIYWINDKVFYLIENLPWAELGTGLGALIDGILNYTP